MGRKGNEKAKKRLADKRKDRRIRLRRKTEQIEAEDTTAFNLKANPERARGGKADSKSSI
jgi:hypothetical protein